MNDSHLRELLKESLKETEDCIEKCQSSYNNLDGGTKLARKFIAEKRFLTKLLQENKEIKEIHLKSSNLRHLKAIFKQLDDLKNVTSVLKIFKDRAQKNVLTVDIVCDSGYTWIKAIAKNPQSMHLIWAGEGNFGEKSIVHQIDEYLKFASLNQHNFQTPKVCFYFASGVTKELSEYLKTRGVHVLGEIVELDEETRKKLAVYADGDDSDDENLQKPQEAHQVEDELEDERIMEENLNNDLDSIRDINRINLDVSTLIALVSELTHGGDEFIFRHSFLSKQAEWERTQHILPVLEEFMKGKELFACETAYKDFMSIVHTVGGPNERERATNLLERIQIVSDNPSERVSMLKESSKIKKRSKVIFGTGDSLQALTMTSNVGFVRAAIQQNAPVPYYIHQSRALTEKKQAFATRISKKL